MLRKWNAKQLFPFHTENDDRTQYDPFAETRSEWIAVEKEKTRACWHHLTSPFAFDCYCGDFFTWITQVTFVFKNLVLELPGGHKMQQTVVGGSARAGFERKENWFQRGTFRSRLVTMVVADTNERMGDIWEMWFSRRTVCGRDALTWEIAFQVR